MLGRHATSSHLVSGGAKILGKTLSQPVQVREETSSSTQLFFLALHFLSTNKGKLGKESSKLMSSNPPSKHLLKSQQTKIKNNKIILKVRSVSNFC